MFAQIYSLQIELLPHKVVVMIHDENTVACIQVVKDYLVKIEDRALKVDLMVFGLMEFNMILEMDWLF